MSERTKMGDNEVQMARIYMDYNATTPLAHEVKEAIINGLSMWGNPSSSYSLGQEARVAIEDARLQIASMIHAFPEEILFTSGGTEANHMVIHSVICEEADQGNPIHIITSTIEHDAILEPLKYLQKQKHIDVTYLEPRGEVGTILVEDVEKAIRPSTLLITLMMANNETGILLPIQGVALSHLQSFDSERTIIKSADLLLVLPCILLPFLKAIKCYEEAEVLFGREGDAPFYGPRIGALYVRGLGSGDGALFPLFRGGGQERGYRPGTENTPMILGLGAAAFLVCLNLSSYQKHMENMRNALITLLKEAFEESLVIHGDIDPKNRLPNTVNFSLKPPLYTVKGREILGKIPRLCASTSAACHSHSVKPSRVLLACGVDENLAAGAIRLSVGRETTEQEIKEAVLLLRESVSLHK
ncbi:unnamed protein product [Darwinula stevensoni]|uniref:Selenocysteine lyase n=1 Tax=Darwinula stevensoni TaxID=69355 RepID=A0A7R8XA56_9CRUS|nr:unnamed protein product [Darwinula stevensoni]CAG0891689.1 unnamed protein product [Darwinula stevensoni]